jgi:hypothetical protein
MLDEMQERFGLGGWHIEIDFDHPLKGGTEAQITRPAYYDTGRLQLARKWAQWDEAKLRHLLAHELGHLLTRDLEEAVMDLKDFFTAQSTWQMFHKRYLQEIEGVVDRYASVIYGKEAA